MKYNILNLFYSKKDLDLIDKIKNIICNKISDDFKIITRYDFETIDLFEANQKGYIKKDISKHII